MRDALVVTGWTAFFLVVLDIVANMLFAYPTDPSVRPGAMEQYLEYGRSIEGKLRRMIGPDEATTAPIARAAWIYDQEPLSLDETVPPDGIVVIGYGMSHLGEACDAMAALDSRIVLALRGGPSATLSHSYTVYLRNRGRLDADVVVLGVLATSFPALETMTHMTWNFESPAPYTYPRYALHDGEIVNTLPQVRSLSELREVLDDPVEWNAFADQLAAHDEFFAGSLFFESPLDHSSLARLLRRALGQRHHYRTLARLHDASGYRSSEAIEVARALLRDFSAKVREDGAVPMVILLNDRGYADHLSRALGPFLKEEGIPFVSSHEVASADDPKSFRPDGHFAHSVNEKLGREALRVMFDEMERNGD